MFYRKAVQLKKRDEQDCDKLQAVHKANPAYGYRRLALALNWSYAKTRRLMKAVSIVSLGAKKKKFTYDPKAIDGDKTRSCVNLLKARNLIAGYPNHIWAEDFTYLKYQNKWYYLATVIDLYSRQIVGWSFSSRHDTELIKAALIDALSKHSNPVILHNDQGSEYCSEQYRLLCESLEIELSFSAKGSPWQNGFQESFYREFKIELDNDHLNRFESLGELTEAIAKQIHYYNHQRIHTALSTNPAAYAAGFVLRLNQGKEKDARLDVGAVTDLRDRVLQKVGA